MFNVVPISMEHAPGFRETLDVVARERRYLGQTEARPIEWFLEFISNNIRQDHAQFVAVGGGQVIGWADIIPLGLPGFGHCGVLGMGVLPEWRHKGVGRALLQATLEKAVSKGLTRIELEVFASNSNAIRLYRQFGFVQEGLKRRARFLDGIHEDVVLMAYVPAIA